MPRPVRNSWCPLFPFCSLAARRNLSSAATSHSRPRVEKHPSAEAHSRASATVMTLALLLAWWPRRPFHRRQRFHVFRDGSAVLGRQLRDVSDHARHSATDGVAIGQLPGFEEISDVLRVPVAESFLRDVRHPPLAFRIRSTGEALRTDDAAKEISRTVTLRAMAE